MQALFEMSTPNASTQLMTVRVPSEMKTRTFSPRFLDFLSSNLSSVYLTFTSIDRSSHSSSFDSYGSDYDSTPSLKYPLSPLPQGFRSTCLQAFTVDGCSPFLYFGFKEIQGRAYHASVDFPQTPHGEQV